MAGLTVNNQFTISSTPSQIIIANGDRLAYSIINISGVTVFIGSSAAMSLTALSSQLPTGSTRNISGDWGDVWAMVAGAPVVISTVELIRQ